MNDKKSTIDTTQELKKNFWIFTHSLKNYLLDKSKVLQDKYYDYRIKAEIHLEEEMKKREVMMVEHERRLQEYRKKYYEQQMLNQQQNPNAQAPTQVIGVTKEETKPVSSLRDSEEQSRVNAMNEYAAYSNVPCHFNSEKPKYSSSFYKGALIGYGLGVMATKKILISPLISAYIFGRLWEMKNCNKTKLK